MVIRVISSLKTDLLRDLKRFTRGLLQLVSLDCAQCLTIDASQGRVATGLLLRLASRRDFAPRKRFRDELKSTIGAKAGLHLDAVQSVSK